MNMVRTMLVDASHIPRVENMWAEGVFTANYIRNRIAYSGNNCIDKTPFETIFSNKPFMAHLKNFRSKAFVHIPKETRKRKFDRRAKLGYLVGYERGNSYRIYYAEEPKITISRDVNIDESNSKSDTVHLKENNIVHIEIDCEGFDTFGVPDNNIYGDDERNNDVPDPVADGNGNEQALGVNSDSVHEYVSADEGLDTPIHSTADQDAVRYDPGLRKSSRKSAGNSPNRLGFDVTMFVNQSNMGNEDFRTPVTYNEAIDCSQRDKEKSAMAEEIKELHNKNTWLLTQKEG